jgi:nucleotide-binding universal stress UspA family protein
MFMGTTLERVIRKGPFPVLMVNNEAQRRYNRVVVPVDMTDASANALRTALALGLIGETGATLLHGFFAAAKGQMLVAGLAMEAISEHVASERQTRTNELTKFLVEKDLVGRWQFRVEEGGPMEVIARAVEQLQPDLLVMGTHGRTRLAKALIGSVTEEVLRTQSVDILVVPPVSR